MIYLLQYCDTGSYVCGDEYTRSMELADRFYSEDEVIKAQDSIWTPTKVISTNQYDLDAYLGADGDDEL